MLCLFDKNGTVCLVDWIDFQILFKMNFQKFHFFFLISFLNNLIWDKMFHYLLYIFFFPIFVIKILRSLIFFKIFHPTSNIFFYFHLFFYITFQFFWSNTTLVLYFISWPICTCKNLNIVVKKFSWHCSCH